MWFFFWAENGFKLEKGKESELVSERFVLVLDGLPDKQTTVEGIQKKISKDGFFSCCNLYSIPFLLINCCVKLNPSQRGG